MNATIKFSDFFIPIYFYIILKFVQMFILVDIVWAENAYNTQTINYFFYMIDEFHCFVPAIIYFYILFKKNNKANPATNLQKYAHIIIFSIFSFFIFSIVIQVPILSYFLKKGVLNTELHQSFFTMVLCSKYLLLGYSVYTLLTRQYKFFLYMLIGLIFMFICYFLLSTIHSFYWNYVLIEELYKQDSYKWGLLMLTIVRGIFPYFVLYFMHKLYIKEILYK